MKTSINGIRERQVFGMKRMSGVIVGVVLLVPLANGLVVAAEGDEKLEFPPLVPDEVITGEVAAGSAVGAAEGSVNPSASAVAATAAAPAIAPPTAAPAVAAPSAAVAAAPVAAQSATAQQSYYQGYQGYPGYQGYQNYQGSYPGYSSYPSYAYPYGYGQQGYPYGYAAPNQGYYGYRRPPPRKSSGWGDMPWMGGSWTQGPWNNGQFSRGDWLGGGPSSWFKGGDFQDGFSNAWDDMINAPGGMGTMPGGWEFPTVSTPNPVDVGDELGRSAPEFVREVPNMIDVQ